MAENEAEHKEIHSCEELKAAITKYESEPNSPTWERYLLNRSVQLGCTEHIPDDWGIA